MLESRDEFIPWTISTKKPSKCPLCASPVATLMGGLPYMTPKLEKEIAEKKVILAGCTFFGDVPSWQCTECGVFIFKNGLPAIEIARKYENLSQEELHRLVEACYKVQLKDIEVDDAILLLMAHFDDSPIAKEDAKRI